MNAPMLLTARLALHQPQAADLPGVAAMMVPDAVRRFLGNRQVDMADEFSRFARNAGSWALYGYGNFVVREHGRPAVVGICGVFHSWRGFGNGLDDVPEAGWIFAQPVWKRGFATEAAGARIGFVAYGEHHFDGSSVVLLRRGTE